MGGDRPHQGANVARISSSWRHPGASGVIATRRSGAAAPAGRHRIEAISHPSSGNGTFVYRRDEVCTTPRVFETRGNADKRVHTRGIEVGKGVYFGTNYSGPMKALGGGPWDERPVMQASTGGVIASGGPSSSRHDEAGIKWPERWRVPDGHPQPQAGRRRHGSGFESKLYGPWRPRRWMFSTTISTAGGGEIRRTADLIGIPYRS